MINQSNIIQIQGVNIKIINHNNDEYICLTDIAKKFGGSKLIENWLRTKSTIEFLGVWEKINNQNFNSIEFEGIKNKAGSNKFLLSAKKWINSTNSIGIIAKTGKYNSGTYAHRNIALEFCSWLSPEFKLYLITEFERLKKEESKNQNLDWNMSRFLASVKYKIQTDSIKENLIPKLEISKRKEFLIYASEADLLNLVIFGKTAKEWRDENPDLAKNNNIRDFANIIQLVVLSNLESSNAKMIEEDVSKEQRLEKLHNQAIREIKSLQEINHLNKKLK
jgi:hypothetical protein